MINLDYQAVKHSDVIEFSLTTDGVILSGILGKGMKYNWVSFPELQTSCQLSYFNDTYWNSEKLADIFNSKKLVKDLTNLIVFLSDMFDKEEQDFYDGKRFMSIREYVFWLEQENESLERDELITEWEKDKHLEYYQWMREQYGTEPL